MDIKDSFFQKFFPNASEFELIKISLDDTDLSIADIFRNIDKIYPKNSKIRMNIESGITVICVICKSEHLYPYSGLIIFISADGVSADIVSSNYVVMTISEDRVTSENKIGTLVSDITNYLISNYHSTLSNLNEFYRRYIYNEHELYE